MAGFDYSKPIIIIGAGGHAKVLIDALYLLKAPIKGICLKELNPDHPGLLGIPILCADDELQKFSPESVTLVNGVGGVKDTYQRSEVFTRFKKSGYTFSQVLHPSAVISPNAVLAEGVQVMAGAILQAGVRVAENAVINTNTSVDHDCHIGNHVHLAPGVTICGNVKIGDSVHVGSGATIIQGISVGARSLIGAGTLVHKNVPAGATVIGVPGKINLT
jgi:sugar O-acyltransferase (sialic acid O-acetyltransferase NeuD family)